MMPAVHVAGHGRSGTSIMGQLFQNIPGYRVVYENSSRSLGWIGVPLPRNLGRINGWLRGRGGASQRIVDKDPAHLLRLAGLCDASGGYGIHMTRDGRDVACSVVRANQKRGQTHRDWLRKRQADQLQPTGWQLAPAQVKLLCALPPRVAVGTVWAYIEKQARARNGAHPRVIRVEYADLVMNPGDTAQRIGEFIEMQRPEQLVARAVHLMTDDPKKHAAHFSAGLHDAKGRTRRIGRWRDEWTRDELLQLDFICGDTYEELGYGRPSAT